MAKESKINSLSRRKFLGASLSLPFLTITKPLMASTSTLKNSSNEFITMLTAEGKTVRVKKNALSTAKVIEKKMSNQSLLSWLKLKESLTK